MTYHATRFWCVTLIVIHIGLLQLSSVRAADADEPEISTSAWIKLERLVERVMACRHIPGLTLTAVKLTASGEPRVVKKQFGWADVEQRKPITADTRMCIASLTKAFSAILLGKLLTNSGFCWDTPLVEILPDYREFLFDDEWVRGHVTPRDILSHRTGVERSYDELWVADAALNKERIVKHIRWMKTDQFRSAVNYNNIIYSLAGHVAERLGGNTWEQLTEELFFRRLNMTSTSFYHQRDQPELFTRQYLHRFRDNVTSTVMFNHSLLSGGSAAIPSSVSICTTATDMQHWIRELLVAWQSADRCHHHGNRCRDDGLLPSETVREVFRTQVVNGGRMMTSPLGKLANSEPLIVDGYGLGWFTGHYRGHDLVLHYGSLMGAYSFISIFPSAGFGVFSSYNGAVQTDPWAINALLHTYIADMFLSPTTDSGPFNLPADWRCHLPPTDYATPGTDIDSYNVTSSSNCWRRHTGVFEHPVLGVLSVSCKQSDQSLRAAYGQIEFDLLTPSATDDDVTHFRAVPIESQWKITLGEFEVVFSPSTATRSTAARYASLSFPLFQFHDGTVFSRTDREASVYNSGSKRLGTHLIFSATTALVGAALTFFG